MIIYHRGTAIQTSVTQARNTFIARAAIFEEDGEETPLGNLGAFASRECALPRMRPARNSTTIPMPLIFSRLCWRARRAARSTASRGKRSSIRSESNTSNGQTVDEEGHAFAGRGLSLTTHDMAKLGLIMLSGGEWQGERLLDEPYAHEAAMPHSAGG
jgi:hypothetical protein